MSYIEVHPKINQITSLFYQIGFWHRGEEATVKATRIKIFYSVCPFLFVLSIICGAFASDNRDESIFLLKSGFLLIVLWVRLLYIIWKKQQILEFLNRVCIHSVEDQEEINLINKKRRTFISFITFLALITFFVVLYSALVLPLLGSEKKLFLDIAFPFDYKNNEIAFWLAYLFVSMGAFISGIAMAFSVFVWYLMINCTIKYEILGYRIKKIGTVKTVEVVADKPKILNQNQPDVYHRDLMDAIESHKQMEDLTGQLESFLSNIFLIQVSTSALSICGSVYSLAYFSSASYVDTINHIVIAVYCIFDIFMVMYFGNEIMLSSDQLSYCLFESDWVDQTQSTKKCVIIFGERLKQPHEIRILKLYPLTLVTFRRILNSAYSMFNVLQNL